MDSSSKDDGSGSSTPPAKVAVVGETLVDRISELPESLLVHILSFLWMHEAIKTCTLSKRWRYLWTSCDDVRFGSKDFLETENSPSFFEHVLAHSTSPNIRTLKLYCDDMSKYKSQISRCLSFVAQKNVEDVALSSNGSEFALPESFRTCSSLTTLTSVYCSFLFDGSIEWKSLESIQFLSFAISDADLLNLLSGCPALESMELALFRGFGRLEINSIKLKILKLCCYRWTDDESDHSLEIVAPYLQHLEISGDLYDLRCRLVDVSSVVNAKLTFDIRCIKDIHHDVEFEHVEDGCRYYHQVFRTLVQNYLQKLIYAAELTIGTWFTEVLCMMQFKGLLIPELKCKYLTLELHLKKFNLYGVAGLLRASPHVEILSIDMEIPPADNSLCHSELSYLAKGDNIDFESWIPSFVFPNLKKVKLFFSFYVIPMVDGYRGMCFKDHSKMGFDKLFKLSEFLLRAAVVLEKFIIISKTIKCNACSTNCVSSYLSRLSEKLSGCPRSSANSVIIFQSEPSITI